VPCRRCYAPASRTDPHRREGFSRGGGTSGSALPILKGRPGYNFFRLAFDRPEAIGIQIGRGSRGVLTGGARQATEGKCGIDERSSRPLANHFGFERFSEVLEVPEQRQLDLTRSDPGSSTAVAVGRLVFANENYSLPERGIARINRATCAGSSIWTKCPVPDNRNSSDDGKSSWKRWATPLFK
jgi:hypothetical protein